jgi:KilA-N domain
MGNHVMKVDFFGNVVRCETDGLLVSLNDLFNAGNIFRMTNGRSAHQLGAFLAAKATKEYIEAAAKEWGTTPEAMLRFTKGGPQGQRRTMAHIALAIYAAEALSPEFHARMHKELIEGRLMQFRVSGGTEFVKLNAMIDEYLPGREDKTSNMGIYVQVAKAIRNKVTGVVDPDSNVWNEANALEQEKRTKLEEFLCNSLRMSIVRDYDHLKDLIKNF